MKGKFKDAPPTSALWAKPIIIGAIIGLATILIIFVIIALLMSFGIFPLSAAPAAVSVSIAIGSFFAGFSAAKKLAKNGLIIGALTGGALFLLFSVIGLAAFKSAPGSSTLIRLIIFVISAAIGGIIGVGNSGKRKIV